MSDYVIDSSEDEVVTLTVGNVKARIDVDGEWRKAYATAHLFAAVILAKTDAAQIVKRAEEVKRRAQRLEAALNAVEDAAQEMSEAMLRVFREPPKREQR